MRVNRGRGLDCHHDRAYVCDGQAHLRYGRVRLGAHRDGNGDNSRS